MGRISGFNTSSETKQRISLTMTEKMRIKFPVENRRKPMGPPKGRKPKTDVERIQARERKNQNDRTRRKLKWYNQ